jgi:hypothetical protein
MFANGSERNEQCLQRTIHRCFPPSFGSVGQAVSEKKIFKNLPIRNKNCLWRPCLFVDWDEISSLYRGPSIDASYQVSVHLTEGFQSHIFVIQFRYLLEKTLRTFQHEAIWVGVHVSVNNEFLASGFYVGYFGWTKPELFLKFGDALHGGENVEPRSK